MMFSSPISISSPDFIIDCRDHPSSLSVFEILRQHNVRKLYAYMICYRNFSEKYEVLKIGQSCAEPGPGTAKAHGERIKRQLGHFPGWNDLAPRSVHGADTWYNVQQEILKGRINPLVNKNSLLVGIWNLDKRRHDVDTYISSESDISEWAEGELAFQYKKAHNGFLPILNYKDPTRNKAYSSNVRLKHLATFVEFT